MTIAKRVLLLASFAAAFAVIQAANAEQPSVNLAAIPSPIIFHGDATIAYRDPAAVYFNGCFYLYFEIIRTEEDHKPYIYTAWSKSTDLVHWTKPKIFTPRNLNLNFGSPGDVIRYKDEWVLCLQTYPRPNGEPFGNAQSRIWMMRSKDLENWGPPELIRVKGPDVPIEKMGRMIDPFLLQDKDDPAKWWCFFKQNGISLSWSRDLEHWTYIGNFPAGENPCVIPDGSDYVLFHSPATGIGVKRSKDLKTWKDEGVLMLGIDQWPWARGRLTAGFVLDLRKVPGIHTALMFFHGSAYPEQDSRGGFNNFASIGLAWSSDLHEWNWPGKAQ